MKAKIVRTFVLTAALATLGGAFGCVADRPSRNGVFNENQYVRKDFLVRPGNSNTPDPGWILKTTIVSASTPNPYAAQGLQVSAQGFAGGVGGGSMVRFEVTQDKLNLLNMREISADADGTINAQGTRTPEVLNAWPVTNVDLKYRVNLDGEKTNFYEENQELDWQLRQWVKLNFAKNDLSDMAPFGTFIQDFLGKCGNTVDASATLHTGSFYVDEQNDYFQFALDITIPVSYDNIPTNSVDPATGTVTQTVNTFCEDAFGPDGVNFRNMGRQNESMTVMYSFMRAKPDSEITYKPLVIEEKDPIQRKYGPISIMTPTRDAATGLLGTRSLAMRWDPAADYIDYYFAPGYPEAYKAIFLDPASGIVKQTNDLLTASGAKTQLRVRNFDEGLAPGQRPREVGDVRYSFIRWMSDIDTGAAFVGVTQFVPDPRTGQILSDSIDIANFEWQDFYFARLDYYEQTIGAVDWNKTGPCQDGDTIPLVPATVASNHNGKSTLFTKMQQYLQHPVSVYGQQGPADFILQEDDDFFHAMHTILPFQIFADPATNPYVIASGFGGYYGNSTNQMAALGNEASFHQLMNKIDRGWAPFDVGSTDQAGVAASLQFLNDFKTATVNHNDYMYVRQFRNPTAKADPPIYDDIGLFQRDSRHCINGQWETRDQYIQNLLTSFWNLVVWHEFGHAMGLDHNFMGSVDRDNFPHYTTGQTDHVGMYTSSVMEYNTIADRMSWGNASGKFGWGPYDQAAISFIYANNPATCGTGAQQNVPCCPAKGVCDIQTSAKLVTAAGQPTVVGSSYSGQAGVDLNGSGSTVTPDNSRWNDPLGYNMDKTEHQYLFCDEKHIKYTPFCRQFDFGTTPSEIIAHDIDNYEWQYLWRNFRQYHKYFDFSQYANAPTQFFTELRRFLPAWAYDWSAGELSDTLRKLGIAPPSGVPAGTYFDQLTAKFQKEASRSAQLYAATSEAIVQQSSGERPYVTNFDPYYGDTTQQGITIDKLQAITQFTSLWQTTNYDPKQAAGAYIASFSIGDPEYLGVAEASATSMVGGAYNIFPYAVPLAVLQFTQATHDPNFVSFAQRPEIRDWTGGHTFNREQDFLDFFRAIAVDKAMTDEKGNLCTSIQSCAYDPRTPSYPTDPLAPFHSDLFNQFKGPEGRRWIWVYIQDRNQWIAADRDRNVATYVVMFNYTQDVIYNMDDGTFGGAYNLQLPLKYFLTYFNQFN